MIVDIILNLSVMSIFSAMIIDIFGIKSKKSFQKSLSFMALTMQVLAFVIAVTCLLIAHPPDYLLLSPYSLCCFVVLGVRCVFKLRPVDLISNFLLFGFGLSLCLLLGARSPLGINHWFIGFHVGAVLFGISFSFLSTGVSCLYLWQERALKRKLIHQISEEIPSLDTLESILSVCLWTSFLTLSLAIGSGLIFRNQDVSTLKTLWAIGIWGLYLSMLLGRRLLVIRTSTEAKLSVSGFFLLLALFGFVEMIQN